MLIGVVGCAGGNRVDNTDLCEKMTFKESHEGGEGLGEEHSRQKDVRKCAWQEGTGKKYLKS